MNARSALRSSPGHSAAARPPLRLLERPVVLIVDDNPDAATLLAEIVEDELGGQPHVAHDGPAALELARAHPPDLVLLDLGLPGMDGYEVARHLQALPGSTVLVAVTGYERDADRARTRGAGFHHHLVKPVRFEVLRDLLSPASAP